MSINGIGEGEKLMLYLLGGMAKLKREGFVEGPDYLTAAGMEAHDALVASGYTASDEAIRAAMLAISVAEGEGD